MQYSTGIDDIKKMNSLFDHTALQKKIAGVKIWVEVDSCSSQTMIDEEVFKKICVKLGRNLKLSKPKKKAQSHKRITATLYRYLEHLKP